MSQPGTAWLGRAEPPDLLDERCEKARRELATALRVDPDEVDLVVTKEEQGYAVRAYWLPGGAA